MRTLWCCSYFSFRPRRIEIGVLHRRLVDEDRLEAAGERGVLFDMLAVFVERGGADAVQLAARQRRLQQVRGIHRAVGLAGADQRVHLVDEQDDAAGGRGHFRSTAFSRSSNSPRYFAPAISAPMSSDISCLSFSALRHVAVDDAQRQALDDRRLADAGLADQHRIVLGAPRQYLDGAADLFVAADHRVELADAGVGGQVAGVVLQRVVALLGTGRIGGAALADIVDNLVQCLRGHAGLGQDVGARGGFLHRQRLQKPLDGDETVACLLGQVLGGREDLRQRLRQIELAIAAFDARNRIQSGFDAEPDIAGNPTGAFNQRSREAFIVVDQNFQDMFGRELLVTARQRHGLRGLDETPDALGVFLQVHFSVSFSHRPALRRQIACGDGPAHLGQVLLEQIWYGDRAASRRRVIAQRTLFHRPAKTKTAGIFPAGASKCRVGSAIADGRFIAGSIDRRGCIRDGIAIGLNGLGLYTWTARAPRTSRGLDLAGIFIALRLRGEAGAAKNCRTAARVPAPPKQRFRPASRRGDFCSPCDPL